MRLKYKVTILIYFKGHFGAFYVVDYLFCFYIFYDIL